MPARAGSDDQENHQRDDPPWVVLAQDVDACLIPASPTVRIGMGLGLAINGIGASMWGLLGTLHQSAFRLIVGPCGQYGKCGRCSLCLHRPLDSAQWSVLLCHGPEEDSESAPPTR